MLAAAAPVKVGIIGSGNVLWAYLQLLDKLIPRGHAVEGPICARREETWPALLARRPGAALVGDPLEVVETDADVILVITSSDTHVEFTRLALEHGKHVVVEKPLAPTYEEGRRLVELATDRGLNLLVAPFVQLAPTFRALWTAIRSGAIGRVHSARGLYGMAGPEWARWYYTSSRGPLGEMGIYNLKSLTALLGPVEEILAAEATAIRERQVDGVNIVDPIPDVSHAILRHESGALSSVVSSAAIQHYRRPALELYGSQGTANLLGDDWDPRGYEIWRNEAGRWEEYESLDPTWLWTDGLREAVASVREGRPPRCNLAHDVHLLDVLDGARRAVSERGSVSVASRFSKLDLFLDPSPPDHRVHDHTRSPEEQ